MLDIRPITRLLDREIWLVTAMHESRRAGLIATFVSDASIVPEAPRMLVGIAQQHHTWSVIQASHAFTLHLLDETQIDLVWRFGLQSAYGPARPAGDSAAPRPVVIDKFAGLDTVRGGVAWLDCRVETSLDSGDRTIYLAKVVDANLEKSVQPLTMKRLLELASPERLQQLRDGLALDAAVDGAAIQRWRSRTAP